MTNSNEMAVGSRESLKFVEAALGAQKGLKILEVGPGSGELASALQQMRHGILVVEPSAGFAEVCQCRGLDTLVEPWPTKLPSRDFDAVLFVRSLHHIGDLSAAISAAHEVLRAGGILILDDFDFKNVPANTRVWFFRCLKRLEKRGFKFSSESFPGQLLATDNEFGCWTRSHDHIHEYELMEQEIAAQFEVLHVAEVAYFYRYIESGLAGLRDGKRIEIGLEILRGEQDAVSSNKIKWLGRRLVAQKALA